MNTLSVKGAAFLRLHEGFRAKAYRDSANVRTIGIGFTWRSKAFRLWRDANKGITFTDQSNITKAQADDCLRLLCDEEYGKAVREHFGKPVAQHVYDGTVSAAYNMGPGSLKWRWGMAVKAGLLSKARELLAVTGITVTVGGKKKVLAGLKQRRAEEGLLIKKGVYTAPSEPVVPSYLAGRRSGDAQDVPESTNVPALRVRQGRSDLIERFRGRR